MDTLPDIRTPTESSNRSGGSLAALAVCLALLAGCAPTPSERTAGVLPGAGSLPGWKPSGATLTFNRETLFDYIDGASEYYFTYTFEQVTTNRYIKDDGAELNVEVWQLAEAQDAFGLFSGRSGGQAVEIGSANEALLESGIRLIFWQNRNYVNLTAVDTVADEDLRLFAEAISGALPAGGEKPAILERLPADGLIGESIKFFHQELAVQDRIWLGGENLLGLGPETDGVLAGYRIGGAEWQLLLVEYPDSAKADAGRQALAGGIAGDLLAADANGSLLGAVFGQGEGSAAENLLAMALGR
jgi:hypothetical protein